MEQLIIKPQNKGDVYTPYKVMPEIQGGRRNCECCREVLEKGRWTYRLTPERLPANIASIENIPCINCPYESRCEVGGIVTPNNCLLIEKWLTQEHETKDNGEKDTFDYDYSLIKVEQ